MVLVSNSESKTIFFIAFVLVFKSQVRQDHEAILLVLESVSKVLFLSDLRTKNIWYWTPTEEFVVLALLDSDKTQTKTTNSPVWVQVHVFMVQQDQDIWHGLKGQDHILVLDSGVYWLILTWTLLSCLTF